MRSKTKLNDLTYYNKKYNPVTYENLSIEVAEVISDEQLCKLYDSMIIERDQSYERMER